MKMQPVVGERPLTLSKEKTEELRLLKRDWKRDPCWDIEETEGFEAHRDELLAFRKEQEQIWNAERNCRLQAKSEELGLPGNLALAEYIIFLEARISTLEDKLIGN